MALASNLVAANSDVGNPVEPAKLGPFCFFSDNVPFLEVFPMKYNTMFDLAFSVEHDNDNPEDVSAALLLDAAQKRIDFLRNHPGEAAEAFGVCDTYSNYESETMTQITEAMIYWDSQDRSNEGWAYKYVRGGHQESGSWDGTIGADSLGHPNSDDMQAGVASLLLSLGVEIDAQDVTYSTIEDGGYAHWRKPLTTWT